MSVTSAPARGGEARVDVLRRRSYSAAGNPSRQCSLTEYPRWEIEPGSEESARGPILSTSAKGLASANSGECASRLGLRVANDPKLGIGAGLFGCVSARARRAPRRCPHRREYLLFVTQPRLVARERSRTRRGLAAERIPPSLVEWAELVLDRASAWMRDGGRQTPCELHSDGCRR